MFLCTVGDLRTNIHSLSARKLEAVHIVPAHVWIALGHTYGDSNIIVIEQISGEHKTK